MGVLKGNSLFYPRLPKHDFRDRFWDDCMQICTADRAQHVIVGYVQKDAVMGVLWQR